MLQFHTPSGWVGSGRSATYEEVQAASTKGRLWIDPDGGLHDFGLPGWTRARVTA